MSSRAMSLKGQIKRYAKDNNIAAQVVLQNLMFERLLVRLSLSPYRNKFVIKGGILIASIVGLATRSTMDLDTTLRDLPLTQEQVRRAITEICKISVADNTTFSVLSIEPIREVDRYGGFCVRVDAIYETIVTPLSIDISTGDVMTPQAMQYSIRGIFDEHLEIPVWGYNIETILAEKVETILSRGPLNTRPRDFYDMYILSTTRPYDPILFKQALQATSAHRGSSSVLSSIESITGNIADSAELQAQWRKYQTQYAYASDISYTQLISALEELLFS